MNNIRIIVVEDENIVALDIKNRLKSLGYNVPALATSGAGAIAKVAKFLPDLVLMDIRLRGEMDGIETAEQIRKQFDIPVIYLTAYADESTLQRAKITAPYGYLLKPFEERELHITIEMAIYRHKMEHKLKESERWLSATLKSIGDGVVALDKQNRLVFANLLAEQYLPILTGGVNVGDELTCLGELSLQTLLNSPPKDRLHHEVLIPGDSGERIFEIIANPTDAEIVTNGTVIVIRDVTEARAIQAQMQQQDRLAVVGQLAAGIAHDFNNLLTSIIGFAELLKHRLEFSDIAQRNLGYIIQQGERAAYLVRQLLDFTRKSIIYKQTIELDQLISETIKLLECTIPETIAIEFQSPVADYTVEGGAAQLQQVLTNLALNARDAMINGGILRFQLFGFSLKMGERPPCTNMPLGNWAAISVSDTGTGISPEAMVHIFEPFFTTKEVGQGTGLGLAQVYGIIKQHEGFIDVKSELGQGTVFTIYLPLLSDSPYLLPQEKRPSHSNVPNTTGNNDQILLLVEDEPSVLEVGRVLLTHLGYQVLTATNGREALDIYNEHGKEIDLVLTDITMPELGGIALAKALKAKNPNSKVVVLTGYPLQMESEELISYGVTDWLLKPLSLEKLAHVVRNSLQTQLEPENGYV